MISYHTHTHTQLGIIAIVRSVVVVVTIKISQHSRRLGRGTRYFIVVQENNRPDPAYYFGIEIILHEVLFWVLQNRRRRRLIIDRREPYA